VTRRRRASHEEPVPIAETLAEVGAELGLPAADVIGTIRDRWPEIAGPQIAPHASVRSLRDGVLKVTVDDAAWATQLRFLAGEVLDRLDAITGRGTVVQVRVSVTRNRDPKTR